MVLLSEKHSFVGFCVTEGIFIMYFFLASSKGSTWDLHVIEELVQGSILFYSEPFMLSKHGVRGFHVEGELKKGLRKNSYAKAVE